jgi:hypothetical protein
MITTLENSHIASVVHISRFALAAGLLLLAACSETPHQVNSAATIRNPPSTQPTFTEEQAVAFLAKSPSFHAFVKRSDGNWAYLLDSLNDNAAEIRVGHNHPEHWETDGTYKVLSNGTVFTMCNECPDDMWKIEYQPEMKK